MFWADFSQLLSVHSSASLAISRVNQARTKSRGPLANEHQPFQLYESSPTKRSRQHWGQCCSPYRHSSQHKWLPRSCVCVRTALALCSANLKHVGVETSSNLLSSKVIQPRQLVEGGAHSHEGGAARPLPSLGSLTELYFSLFFHGYWATATVCCQRPSTVIMCPLIAYSVGSAFMRVTPINTAERMRIKRGCVRKIQSCNDIVQNAILI